MLLCVAVAAALALPGLAHAGTGPSYEPTLVSTPPTIDGTISAGEWGAATPYSLQFGSLPATVRFEESATMLYIAVTVQDLLPGPSPSLTVWLDNNDDGIRDLGDDAWYDFVGSAGQDSYYIGGSETASDTPGGTNDTIASGTSTLGNVTFEIAHPLCSSDTAHDICLQPSQVAGINFQYQPGTGPGIFWDAPGPSLSDATAWGNVTRVADTTHPDIQLTSPLVGTVLSGTVTVSATASDNVGVTRVLFWYWDGSASHQIGEADAPPYTMQFDTTQYPDNPHAEVSATAYDAAGNNFSSGVDLSVQNGPPATGSISGSVNTFGSFPVGVDLTATGDEDWAIWGVAGSTSLAPDDRKAGTPEIGALSYVPSPGSGVRAFGNDPANPYGFTWSNGSPTAAASGAHAGLTDPSLGYGVSFTVPADTSTRTLTVFTSAHYADGTLTATLSDGSASPYSGTFSAHAGDPGVGENVPAVFTIHYHAAGAGQHLTVTWTQSANNSCGGCEDVVLYAAALSQDFSASLSTDGSSIGMSGSNVALSDMSLDAFSPSGAGTTRTVNGLPINSLPINSLPINSLPINSLPINSLPINSLPINSLPINSLSVGSLPINSLPINSLPINSLPLTTPGGWQALLAGTSLAGLPLQTVTLAQVLALPSPPHVNLGDLDVSNSALGNETLGALALGSTPINSLGLSADTLAALVQWCQSVSASRSDCTAANLGNYSLFTLGLAGAPINSLPINSLPINSLPINSLPINSLPINSLSLSASPINSLPINSLPPTPALAAAAAGLPADATLGMLPDGSITIGGLLQSLLAPTSPVRDSLTFADVLGMLIRRADVPWETLPPRELSVFDPSRPSLPVALHFHVGGAGPTSAVAEVTLPPGFDVAPSTSALSVVGSPLPVAAPGDPVISGRVAKWTLTSIQPGVGYDLAFDVWSGTQIGPTQLGWKLASGGATASGTTPLAVTDSFEPNGNPNAEGLPTITPDAGVQQSAISSRGDVDYYRIPMPPAGTRLQVHLSNLPADYDLALYSAQTTSVRTTSVTGTPLQDATVSDQPVDLQGGANAQLAPTALQDVPNPGVPIVQVSANRGTDDEDVGMVSPGGGGSVLIAVFGYNGASSDQPYTLRVTTKTPQALTCAPRTFSGAGTAGALPAISSLPADLNTLILVNEKRMGDTYGAAGEADVVSALTRLAGDRSLGVSGAVVPVEALAQAQYDAWDANPCDASAANSVANAIADEIAQVKAARPTLKYVVFAGGDDQVPFFRVPDLALIANESGFASAFGRNEYYGALAGGNVLSDNPYLDTRPIPASGRSLFIPNLAGGRLVETPSEIASAVSRFESPTVNGTLAASTAFVSGYDFVSDGSALVQANLARFLGTGAVQSLIGDTWSKSDLLSHAFPAAGPAAINDWNGHYDNYEALPATGDHSDLLTTADLTGSHALDGGIFFTMGCHAGLQTTDAIVGSPVLDWAQYFAGTGTGFVGNTGFGLGNTDSVAFSEELMSDFAANLGGSLSIGDALMRAKQSYFLGRTAFSSYDEKTLSEAELYGLPMYGVGRAPAPVGSSTPPPAAAPDPVNGSTASASPSQGALTSLPGTSAQVAPFAVTPSFGAMQTGAHGNYFTNGGQVQAPNYRPLQPYVTLPATRTGLVAHGVLIDSLTSNDVPDFNPDNVRPTLDLSANEPEPQFSDEAWPEKVPTLISFDDGSSVRQSLNLITGQFFTDGSTSAGVERTWTQIGGRVAYSTSSDFVPPTIDSIDAFLSNGSVSFAGRFSDLTETGAHGTVALAQVVYDVDNSGTWRALPLQQDVGSGVWSGGASFNGQHVQFFVEACDVAGNCGFSSNKGRYYDAQPLPVTTGTVTITPSRTPDTGTWYTSPVDATATSSTNAVVDVSVDGGAFAAANGAITIGAGVHTVDARGADGSETTRVFLVDTQAPSIAHTVSPAAPDGANGWYVTAPTVAFTCADDVSGVADGSCVVDGQTAGHVTLGDAPGTQSVSATAVDNAGHAAHDSVAGLRVDLNPPTAPAFTGIAAQIYAVNDVPGQSAIACTSTDSASGVASCVVTGYGSGIGSHTLVATATDNAGHTATSRLTYVVGFQAGNVLAPVTAPSGDQTSPTAADLQVLKIKSTIPVKFRMWLDAAKTTMMTTPPAGSTARIAVGKYGASTVSTGADAFRWTGGPDYQYIYNLSTAGLTSGTYWVSITLYSSGGTVLAQSTKQYFILRT